MHQVTETDEHSREPTNLSDDRIALASSQDNQKDVYGNAPPQKVSSHEYLSSSCSPVDGVQGCCADDSLPADTPDSLLRTVQALVNVFVPYGGMLSSGFNMTSTSVGAGILGLPAAFASVGIVMATFYLVLITAETVYSMRLLVLAAEKCGEKTFEAMAKKLLHPKADILVACIRVLHTFGGAVAYVVTIGDLLKPIFESIDGIPHFLLTKTGRKLVQSGFWLVFMFPLVIPRQVNSLRYASAFGLIFILFFCFVVIVHSGMYGLQQNPRPPTELVNIGNKAIDGLGVFIFSFMCQINCLEIYFEMTKRNLKRFTICCTISMILCAILYYATGIFGYIDFGDNVKGSILLQYNPIKEPQVLVSYIGVFIKVCASFGLVNHACRSALFPLFGWHPQTVVFWKHLIGAITLALIALILGLFVPNINIVFGLTGGVCGGSVGFILPALLIMYAGDWSFRKVGVLNYCCTYLVLLAGVVAMVFGTASAIYSIAT